jgi:hypothetical protein
MRRRSARRSRPRHLVPASRPDFSRREILALGGAGAATLLLSACGLRPTTTAQAPRARVTRPYGPIDRSLGETAPRGFSGDDPGLAHRVLWDLRGFLAEAGGLPAPEERIALAIVGGGLSGLASAWLLRDHRPVVLERAARFGGNSRGEAWGELDYSIGAAYFMMPDAGSPIEGFLRSLQLSDAPRVKDTEDPVVLAGKRFDSFWDGASDPGRAEEIRSLGRYFRSLFEETDGLTFPEIPPLDAEGRTRVDELDRRTFRAHLEARQGGALHPHVEAAIEHYCWSSFGASMNELGAASGLNFYAAEFGDVCVLPGGNAGVAERLVERLDEQLPDGSLRPSSLVVDVRPVEDGVLVTWLDAARRLRCLHARAAVVACPKFVAAKILPGLEPERSAAIGRLTYRAYQVANVLLRRSIPDDFYDLFLAGGGEAPGLDVEKAAKAQGVTDIVLGNWAHGRGPESVLTLYAALPWDGGREEIYEDGAYATQRAAFERQLLSEILPLVGAREDEVVDLRLARWGHPLPVAASGLLADGVVDRLRAPLGERIFFVEQDNWALPAFETAISEALIWAPEIAARLRR